MATLDINGKRVEVDDSFLKLSPQEQERTVEEIAKSLGAAPAETGRETVTDDSGLEVPQLTEQDIRAPGLLAQAASGEVANNSKLGFVNQGIANTIDFVNPFDDPAWQDVAGGKFHTGPAADLFRSAGIATADREPDGITEGFARGAGDAAAALIPVVGGLSKLRGVGGAIGQFADDAYRSLTSLVGAGGEVVAGGVGGAAEETAEAAGAPDWVQDTAALLAPMAFPGAAGLVTKVSPVARGVNWARRNFTPQTPGGAREVARDELRARVGENRAAEVAGLIDPDESTGATPGQMTGDPALIRLERAATAENPELRERIAERDVATRTNVAEEIRGTGGDFADTRKFFANRLKTYRDRVAGAVERVMGAARDGTTGMGPGESEVANSTKVVGQLKSELADFEAENAQKWAAIPLQKVVPVGQSRRTLLDFVANTPQAQQNDIPAIAKRLLGEDGFGEQETAAELHGLYSELRRIARGAASGEPGKRNMNLARISNSIADAILEDLGAVDETTEVGRRISDALAHTRAMHETFDQGAPGRLLKRTATGDEAIAEPLALQRTVGQGGIAGDVDAEKITTASPTSTPAIQDYLRSQFSEVVLDADGNFARKPALEWMRKNKELMDRYPNLKRDFFSVIGDETKAKGFAARAELRAKLADDSVAARFSEGPAGDAIKSILTADDPLKAARAVVRSASKDASGASVEGVKSAFSDFLVNGALKDGLLSGAKLHSLVTDPKFGAAMREIYSPAEVARIKRIAGFVRNMDADVGDAGKVIDREANKLLETVVRVAAARAGGQMGAGGSMGGSLQTANIFASRAGRFLDRLTNESARRLLMDAVEDPALMRELLTEPKGVKLPERTRSKLAPYLTGGAAAAASDERQVGVQ